MPPGWRRSPRATSDLAVGVAADLDRAPGPDDHVVAHRGDVRLEARAARGSLHAVEEEGRDRLAPDVLGRRCVERLNEQAVVPFRVQLLSEGDRTPGTSVPDA